MKKLLWCKSEKLSEAAALEELRSCETFTAPFGLTLTETQMHELLCSRSAALSATGRVETGSGVLKKLAYAFCDSPYVTPENYADTLAELQDSFYYFKNESEDELSDDELIDWMVRYFNGRAQGSLEYLANTSLNDLCRSIRDGLKPGNGEGMDF